MTRPGTGDKTMFYISNGHRPVDTKTYDTVADLVAAFTAPAWAGAAPTEMTMTGEMTFRSRGQNYEIVAGENPTAARRATAAAMPTKADAATKAQLVYLSRLGDQVPASVRAAWIKPNMTKAQASLAINNLKSIATL